MASWLVIAVAVLAANLPFFNERLFGIIPLKPGRDGQHRKSGWLRAFELLVLYFVVGAIAWLVEGHLGKVHPQTKEFYMTTVPLFVTLAFPGFILRYLRKRSR